MALGWKAALITTPMPVGRADGWMMMTTLDYPDCTKWKTCASTARDYCRRADHGFRDHGYRT
jgi:hypothetical protein